jgi:cell division protein FtsB
MKNISIRQGPNDNKIYEDAILEINEYIIQKGNIPITFFLSKTKNYIIIRSISYELKLTPNDFSIITKQIFRSNDEIYQLLKNIFEKKNILIQEISNKVMKLIISFFDSKKLEIYLPSQKEINSYIINDLFTKFLKLEENMNILNQKNKQLTEENLKYKAEIIKMKNDMIALQTQNKANENHINLILSGIDKINSFIDNRPSNQNIEKEAEDNQENIKNQYL